MGSIVQSTILKPVFVVIVFPSIVRSEAEPDSPTLVRHLGLHSTHLVSYEHTDQ